MCIVETNEMDITSIIKAMTESNEDLHFVFVVALKWTFFDGFIKKIKTRFKIKLFLN